MNYTIILRHADRQHIGKLENTEKADLTFKGILNSIMMGFYLTKFKHITKIKTSYILRCYNTAKYLKIGYAPLKKIEIKRAINNGELVSSGYIKNENFWDWIRYQYIIKKDWKKFKEYYNEMIKRGWAQFNSIEDYTNRFMQENLTNENTLIITHDTTIIPILIGLKKYGVEEKFPKPLSGIIIYHEKGEIQKIELIKRGKIHNI